MHTGTAAAFITGNPNGGDGAEPVIVLGRKDIRVNA